MSCNYYIKCKILNPTECSSVDTVTAALKVASILGLDPISVKIDKNDPFAYLEQSAMHDWDYNSQLEALSKSLPNVKFRFTVVTENDECWREYYWNGESAYDDAIVRIVMFDNPPDWANETEFVFDVRK